MSKSKYTIRTNIGISIQEVKFALRSKSFKFFVQFKFGNIFIKTYVSFSVCYDATKKDLQVGRQSDMP